MTALDQAIVAELLRAAGLNHPIFDPAEVAADLAQRTTDIESLDELLAGRSPCDVTAHRPEWHR
jgi:hypothetical protein